MNENEYTPLEALRKQTLAEMRLWRGKGANGQADLVRVTFPGKAKKADYGNSMAHAIDLFCYSCMGGARKEVANCGTQNCPLWPYRPGALSTIRTPGQVPSVAQYDALLALKDSGGRQRARAKNGAENEDAEETD